MESIVIHGMLPGLDENVVISSATVTAITDLHEKILRALDQTLLALEDEDRAGAERTRAMKQGLSETLEAIAAHEIQRLQTDEPRRLVTYTREIELIGILDDIFHITRRIAATQTKIFDAEQRGKVAGGPTA